MATRKLEIILAGDAQSALRAFREVEGAGKTTGEKLKDVGSRISGFGKKASVAITLPFVAMAKVAFDASSDTAESLSKVGVVFGDHAAGIEAFAGTAATNLGISNQAALEAAGTFGNLFTAMGLGQKEAADLSPKIVTLASDLGSFNNIAPEEALEKLRAGLVGEVEPLRALGVNMNAAMVEAKAMELGLVGLDGEVTEAGKVQARYALIMEQTTTAQGDFARTADGAANKQRIMRARLADSAATMGTQLLPVITPIVTGIADLAEKFSNLSPTVRKVILVVGGLLAVIGPIATVIGGLISVAGALMPVLAAVGGVIGALLSPIGLVVAAVVGLAFVIWKNWDTIKRVTLDLWNSVKAWTAGAWTWVKNAFSTGLNFVKAVWTTYWNAISSFYVGIWNTLKAIASGAWNFIRSFISTGLQTLTGIWRGAWDGIRSFLSGVWSGMRSTVSSSIGTVVSFFAEMPGRILRALGNIGGLLVDKGKDLIDGFARGVRSVAGNVAAAVKDAILSAVRKVPLIGGRAADWLAGALGDGPGMNANYAAGPSAVAPGGNALRRVQSVLSGFSGARVTSTYRTPDQNRRVGGSPTSYHMDRNNPAVDIGGPTSVLDRLAAKLRSMGGWREFLWRVKGHFDHIHVAHQGGYVTPQGIAPLRSDELMTKLQVGETVIPRGGVRGHDGVAQNHYHFHIGTFVGSDERALAELIQRAKRKGYVGV